MTAVRVKQETVRPFFTIHSLAEYLSISPRTIRDMLAKGRIPSYKIEGQWRVDARDVDAYLARVRTDKRPVSTWRGGKRS